MGFWDDPATMALLGMGAGFGQASAPSRLPVPLGLAMGGGAKGLLEGAQAFQAAKKAEAESSAAQIQNQLLGAQLQGWRSFRPDLFQGQGQPQQEGPGLLGRIFGGGAQPAVAQAPGTVEQAPGTAPVGRSPVMLPGQAKPMGGIIPGAGQSPLDAMNSAFSGGAAFFPGSPISAALPDYIKLLGNTNTSGKMLTIDAATGRYRQDPVPGAVQTANLQALAAFAGNHGGNVGDNGIISPAPGAADLTKGQAQAEAQGKENIIPTATMTAQNNKGAQDRLTGASDARARMIFGTPVTLHIPNGNDLTVNPVTAHQLLSDPTKLSSVQQDGQGNVSVGSTKIPAAPTQTVPGVQSMGTEQAKYASDLQAGVPGLADAEGKLVTMGKALEMISGGSNALAEHKAELQAVLSAAGINLTKEQLGSVTGVQTALHENWLASLKTMRETMANTASRMGQQEIMKTADNMIDPVKQPGANLQILGETLGNVRAMKDIAGYWPQAQSMGWTDPYAYTVKMTQTNPLEQYVDAAKSEFPTLLKQSKGTLPGGAPGPLPAGHFQMIDGKKVWMVGGGK